MISCKNNVELFEKIHSNFFPYYSSWCHDYPIVISKSRDKELERLQQILYRVCEFYVFHYKDYLDIISYPDSVLEILDYSSHFPFKAGTFRPDFIIDTNGNIRICEITSRFFGNGYFMSYFMEKAGAVFAQKHDISDYKSHFEDFFDYVVGMKGNNNRLLVLKSNDKSDSIKLYVPFYQSLGMEVQVIEAADVESNIPLFSESMIVSALNQNDLLSFSMETLKTMANFGVRNDFRTIFLLHDKRLFHLFFKDSFTKRFLSDEDTLFLRNHTIYTSIPGTDENIWKNARINKNGYILKHHCLGKSEKVFAGPLTDSNTWNQLFENDEISEMILQPFIDQKTFVSPWKDQILREYISPSILCIDDKYFGAGLFRSSSFKVINQGDAHKIAPIITDQPEKLGKYNVL